MLGAAAPASAQSYPSKTITIVSPAPAGGVTDIIGRGLAQRFSKSWGQQAVVENKPGANNQLAAEYIVNSPPDGHTLFIAPDGTFVANPSLYPKLPYDPYKSFTPISGLMIINHGLILNKDFAPNNVAELVALAKQKPGEINYGTYGIGSSGHLNMVLLETMAGMKLQAVHYKGAAPVLNDVLAGHIQMGFVSAGSAVQQMKAGLLKMVAVGGKKRIPQLPDIPTVAETVPGYEAVSWFGLFGPAGMPPDDGGEDQQGGPRAVRRSRIPEDVPRPLSVPVDRGLARGIDELRQVGGAEVAQDHPGRKDQGGVMSDKKELPADLRKIPRQLRRDVRHVAAVAGGAVRVLGRRQSGVSPRLRAAPQGRVLFRRARYEDHAAHPVRHAAGRAQHRRRRRPTQERRARPARVGRNCTR